MISENLVEIFRVMVVIYIEIKIKFIFFGKRVFFEWKRCNYKRVIVILCLIYFVFL